MTKESTMDTTTLEDKGAKLYAAAVNYVRAENTASVSFLQRKLQIGHNLAASIMGQLVEHGVCSEPDQTGKRQVLGSITIEAAGKIVTLSDKQLKQAAARVPQQTEIAEPSTYGGFSGASKEKLRQTVARIERLEEEKREVAEQIKDTYADAKAFGFDAKILRQVIRIRKIDRASREEQEMVLDTYLLALGEI
jgi:uncharacterized protein (UPF0335 family)